MAENLSSEEFIVLEGDEVIALDEEIYKSLELNGNFFQYLYLTNPQLIDAIIRRVSMKTKIHNKLFFDDGLECELLKPGGKSWQKGKLKVELNVKFYPDEPEEEIEKNEAEIVDKNNSENMETEVSPLDDLRQKFNQENQ